MRPFLLMATSLIALAASPTHGRAEVRNPHGIAVIIGNKTYQNKDIPEVKYADRDAQAIKDYVIDVLGYAEDNIIFLPNATESNLLSVFGSADDPDGKLARYMWDGGRSDVFVYYSGHGVPSLKDGQPYLLPVDADPSAVSQTGFSLELLKTNLQKIGARSVTVLLDACFSGGSAGGQLLGDASVMTRPASPVPAGGADGVTWIAASGATELANWDNRHRHGLFTEYFLEAVYGRADDPQYGGHHDGRITLAAVQDYLDEEMSHFARREIGRFQKATISGDPGFVLASLTPDAPPQRHDETTASTVPFTDAPAPGAPAPPAPAEPESVPQASPAPAAPPPVLVASADELERQGEAALGRGERVAALGLFRQAAALGKTAAMDNIGLLYEVGLGVHRDYAEAMRWFRKAADAGDTMAPVYVGNMYRDGEGVPADPAEARRWFAKGANAGNQIGRMAVAGAGLQLAQPGEIALTGEAAFTLSDSDRRLVQQWLAALGHDPGGTDGAFGPATQAAIMAYQRSIGAPATGTLTADEFARLRDDGAVQQQAMTQMSRPHPPAASPQAPVAAVQVDDLMKQAKAARDRKDYATALSLFRQAAAGGDTEAMNEIGLRYDKGEGVAKDYAEALRWFRKAADNGNAWGQYNLGFCYDMGYGVAHDPAEALRWYRLAADKGNARALFSVGWYYEHGEVVSLDYSQALQWFHQAADKGNATAMNEIGYMYDHGYGVRLDDHEAFGWFRMAAEKGNVLAMRNLGRLYGRGAGVPRDVAEARRWLSKAADLGDQPSRDELAKL